MKRTFLVAGLAIAAVFVGSMTLVFSLAPGDRSTGSPADAPGGDPLPPPAVPVVTAPPSRAAPVAGPKRMHTRGWNAPADGPSWGPMASRVTRKLVRKALLAAPVQSRLARCADRVGGFGGPAAPGPVPGVKPAVLMLEMESLGREVRIVDAQVREWGGASEAMVSCARGVLKGRVIPAPTAREERMRMPFPLNPRSDVVASSR